MNSYGVPFTKKTFKEEMSEKLLEKWKLYGLEYQSIMKEYDDLIEYRKQRNIGSNRIKQSILNEFPDIPFLALSTVEEAEKYLSKLSDVDLKILLSKIEMYLDSCVYHSLKTHIREFRYDLRRRARKKAKNG